jgi:hypothetical protein
MRKAMFAMDSVTGIEGTRIAKFVIVLRALG